VLTTKLWNDLTTGWCVLRREESKTSLTMKLPSYIAILTLSIGIWHNQFRYWRIDLGNIVGLMKQGHSCPLLTYIGSVGSDGFNKWLGSRFEKLV
jgi:hypothetical protein